MKKSEQIKPGQIGCIAAVARSMTSTLRPQRVVGIIKLRHYFTIFMYSLEEKVYWVNQSILNIH